MVAAQESSQARQKLGGCVLRRAGEERGLEAGAAESVAAVVVVIVASFHERFTVALVDTFCQIFTNFHLSAKRRRQNCLCSGVRPPLSLSFSLLLCLSCKYFVRSCKLFVVLLAWLCFCFVFCAAIDF